jgi:hypothetical protein
MQVPFQELDHQRNIWTKCYLEFCNFGGMVDSTINFGSPRVHLKHWCEQGSSFNLLQTKFQQAPTIADIDDLHKHVVCATTYSICWCWMTCENREEGRKEGFLARIAIFSFLFVYCGCFFNFFGCQFQNLCVVFFFVVADCEGFWSEGCGTSWFCLLRDRDRTSEATLSTPSFRS